MKRVSFFGYGGTTRSLITKFPNAIFYDDNCVKPFKDKNGFKIKPASEFNPKYSDLEIPSPGIAPSNLLIKKAQNLKSEYDIFTDTKPLKIWISGTNGKTTTTQMMQHLLAYQHSQAGGNIGTPLANLNQDAKIWILETSSFMMHYTNMASPNIYILLPINPDHLSWHGNFKEYEDAKLKPLFSMGEGEVAIIPTKYKNINTKAHAIYYENENDLANYFDINIKKINFHGAFLLDAILAMAVEKILFDKIIYEKINSFKLDAHRQEEIKDAKKRLWVNDTKATNIDATIAALKRYKSKHIHLILGGDDKGVELSELFIFLQTIDVSIYNIGTNKNKLSNLAKEHGVNFKLCTNLQDAINKISNKLEKNDVALLSPAASSLDEFSSYAQRGENFKQYIRNLKI